MKKLKKYIVKEWLEKQEVVCAEAKEVEDIQRKGKDLEKEVGDDKINQIIVRQ